jgi:hypothetical protein
MYFIGPAIHQVLSKSKGLHRKVWKTLPYPISSVLVMTGIVKLPPTNAHTIFLIQGRNFNYVSILYLFSFDNRLTCSTAAGLDEQIYHSCKRHGNISSVNLKFKIFTSCFSVRYAMWQSIGSIFY